MNRLQSKVEEAPGYNEPVDYFVEKYKDGEEPSDEIAEFIDSANIQKYFESNAKY